MKILVYFINSLLVGTTFSLTSLAQPNLTSLDNTVALIEKHPKISLYNKLSDLVPSSNSQKQILTVLNVDQSNEKLELKGYVDQLFKIFKDSVQSESDSALQSEYNQLYHHTQLLFHELSFNDKKGFDETLLVIFHQQRNKLSERLALIESRRAEATQLGEIKKSLDTSNELLVKLIEALNGQKKEIINSRSDARKMNSRTELAQRKDAILKAIPRGNRLAMNIHSLDSACLAGKEQEINKVLHSKKNKNLSFWTFRSNNKVKEIIRNGCSITNAKNNSLSTATKN